MDDNQQPPVNNEDFSQTSDETTERLEDNNQKKLNFLKQFMNSLQHTTFTKLNWFRLEVKKDTVGITELKKWIPVWDQLERNDSKKVEIFFLKVRTQLKDSQALDSDERLTPSTQRFYVTQQAALEEVVNQSKKRYHL